MKPKLLLIIVAFIGLVFQSCDNSVTYAERKEAEKKAISAFIEKSKIKVISEAEFKANGEKTDTAKNEFVLFDDDGLYMQIVQKGTKENGESGSKMEDGRHTLLARYIEVNLEENDTLSTNFSARIPDEMVCIKEDDSFTGTFTATSMMSVYGAAVPSGWLKPLTYLTPVRTYSSDKIARVRLIVPHSMGQSKAINYVYPCYYEITYQPFK